MDVRRQIAKNLLKITDFDPEFCCDKAPRIYKDFELLLRCICFPFLNKF